MDVEKLKARLRSEMPSVADSYIEEKAAALMNTIPEIRAAVEMWAETGNFKDVRIEGDEDTGGGFSIRKLMSFRRIHDSFADAALYLNEYAKDKEQGFLKILRLAVK